MKEARGILLCVGRFRQEYVLMEVHRKYDVLDVVSQDGYL